VDSGASLFMTSNTASSTASLTTASRPVATSPAPPDLTSSKVNLVVKLFQNRHSFRTSQWQGNIIEVIGTSRGNHSIVFGYVIPRCAKHESDTTLVLTSVATAPLFTTRPLINTLSHPIPFSKANTAGRMDLLGHLHFRDQVLGLLRRLGLIWMSVSLGRKS